MKTISRSRGSTRSTFLRLCSRAPRMTISSGTATPLPTGEANRATPLANGCSASGALRWSGRRQAARSAALAVPLRGPGRSVSFAGGSDPVGANRCDGAARSGGDGHRSLARCVVEWPRSGRADRPRHRQREPHPAARRLPRPRAPARRRPRRSVHLRDRQVTDAPRRGRSVPRPTALPGGRPLLSWLGWLLHPQGGGSGLVLAIVDVNSAALLLGGLAAGGLASAAGARPKVAEYMAFLFPLAPGSLAAFGLSTADILATALALSAILLSWRGRPASAIAAGVLAVLAKESILLLLIGYAPVAPPAGRVADRGGSGCGGRHLVRSTAPPHPREQRVGRGATSVRPRASPGAPRGSTVTTPSRRSWCSAPQDWGSRPSRPRDSAPRSPAPSPCSLRCSRCSTSTCSSSTGTRAAPRCPSW